MPTYVYHCKACDTTFEADQRITEDPLTSCACGSSGTVKRIIQPIAVMFKGSGFHINDYAASTSAPKAETSSTEPKSEGDAKSEATPKKEGETKSETPKDTTPTTAAASATESAQKT
jgi:putative FmdB family regulatory protein